MNIWITSDNHWFHANIIKYSKRTKFSSVEEMNELMIQAWNSVVRPEDHVYCLGDLAISKDRIALEKLFKRLSGKKFLIPGNHDKWVHYDEQTRRIEVKPSFINLIGYWTILPQYYEMKIDGQKMSMCHFANLVWNKSHQGSWMLHGHSHTSLDHMNVDTKRLDCGVDSAYKLVGEYRPLNLFDEIKPIMDKKIYKIVDHHGTKKTSSDEEDE